jgi:outer membrane protein OmpA-like peptidoglycan-associated protein
MFRFCLLILILVLSRLSFAHVIVIEHHAKPSVEVNLSVLQEFQKISDAAKVKVSHSYKEEKKIPQLQQKISSKTLSIAPNKNREKYELPAELVRDKDKKQATKEVLPPVVIDLKSQEEKIKKDNTDKRLAEALEKEKLLKQIVVEQKSRIIEKTPEVKEKVDIKLSRAKNLLRKVEKNLLKTKAKNKEYTLESEVKQVNLSGAHSQKAPIKTEVYSTNYESSSKAAKVFVIKFPQNVNDIKSTMNGELNKIAALLTANQDKRVRIVGYSSGKDKSQDVAAKRRNALEKVVAVRKYLVDRGVNTRQVSLQAAGDSASKGSGDSGDRVEVVEIGL